MIEKISDMVNMPVALFFFNRPEPLKKVFEQVKKARPNKLFLVQDGVRLNKNDYEKVLACRKVVSDIDWVCEVFINYSEVNLGVGKRISSGIEWAFENVDRLIILEDDCVPCQSFFSFSEELLEKYLHDERVNMISGMNHLEVYDSLDTSYFFCNTGAIWGWATWKRVWGHYDFDMGFYKEKGVMKQFSEACYPRSSSRALLKRGRDVFNKIAKGETLSAWTYQFRMIRHLQSQLVIVPKKNLISNIGITDDTTHASDSLKKIPNGLKRVFFMKTHNLEIPLIHPKYMIADVGYDKKIKKIMGEYFYSRVYRRVESVIRQIIYK